MSRPSILGQALTDYLLLLALVAVALSIGADGPVQQLATALAEHYSRFTWSISLP
jgi:hypothetical protein